VSETTDSATQSVSSETSVTPAGSSATQTEKEAAKITTKHKKSKYDVAGELLDKLVSVQEKSDKMMVHKRIKMEEHRMELEAQMRTDERNFQFPMMNVFTRANVLTCHRLDNHPIYIRILMIPMPHRMYCRILRDISSTDNVIL